MLSPHIQHWLVCGIFLKKQRSVSPSPLPESPCKYPMFVVTNKKTSTLTKFWHKVLCLCFLLAAREEIRLCCNRTGQALYVQPSLFCLFPLKIVLGSLWSTDVINVHSHYFRRPLLNKKKKPKPTTEIRAAFTSWSYVLHQMLFSEGSISPSPLGSAVS